ncbi:MAG: transposase [Syntrophales bacterium]
MLLMDNATGKVIAHKYHYRENFESAYQMFKEMHDGDLNPEAITIDGNTSVIRALRAVWPDIIIQRCITHIQRQGLAWLRRYPKIQASKDLRMILLTVTEVKDRRRRDIFIKNFEEWEKRHGQTVQALPSNHKVYGDLQRTRSLVLHALPHMFSLSWQQLHCSDD